MQIERVYKFERITKLYGIWEKINNVMWGKPRVIDRYLILNIQQIYSTICGYESFTKVDKITEL